MWRKDVQDTISSCEIHETPFDLYLMGLDKPHYPLPAVKTVVIHLGNAIFLGRVVDEIHDEMELEEIHVWERTVYSDELIHLLSK